MSNTKKELSNYSLEALTLVKEAEAIADNIAKDKEEDEKEKAKAKK